ncbi:MAG: L-threonylcarbamoyladenylate synthase [Oscillospiraceae bacterium]|nr:L-threonylcarbamoyladenylate synthase [Oscillospiraceae bacterium]
MKTVIETTESRGVEKAVALLNAGEVVALPTETVYGLAGNALNPDAVAKIFTAKNRPQDNPLIVHVSDLSMAKSLELDVPPLAEKLSEKYWSGKTSDKAPLTMIFRKVGDLIPSVVSCGLDSVAVRVPNSPVMIEIIEKCDFPLAAPSANLSGSPSPTRAVHVFDDLNGKIPLIIDGGDCEVGIESTVIAFEGSRDKPTIQILRPGAVTPEMLSEFAEVVVDVEVTADCGVQQPGEAGIRAQVLCPGTKYKHYSPKAEVIAVISESDLNCEEYEHVINNPETRTLYAKLREFDELGVSRVYIRLPEQRGVGLALYNRIIRAANYNVLDLTQSCDISVGFTHPSCVYGLTGMSGAGKSVAAKVFAERGFTVIDCDVTARAVIERSPCIDEVKTAFPHIFSGGVFDRKKAAEFLFSDKAELARYQSVVFPYVTYEILRLIGEYKSQNKRILLDAPTLFQSGADDLCSQIIAVVADESVCVNRITRRDGISEESALKRLRNQPSLDYFKQNCDIVIENNGSLDEFVKKIEELGNI